MTKEDIHKFDKELLIETKKRFDKISKNIFIQMSKDWEIDIQNSIENTNNLKKSLEFIKELINQN
jgi:hypothetical protein